MIDDGNGNKIIRFDKELEDDIFELKYAPRTCGYFCCGDCLLKETEDGYKSCNNCRDLGGY